MVYQISRRDWCDALGGKALTNHDLLTYDTNRIGREATRSFVKRRQEQEHRAIRRENRDFEGVWDRANEAINALSEGVMTRLGHGLRAGATAGGTGLAAGAALGPPGAIVGTICGAVSALVGQLNSWDERCNADVAAVRDLSLSLCNIGCERVHRLRDLINDIDHEIDALLLDGDRIRSFHDLIRLVREVGVYAIWNSAYQALREYLNIGPEKGVAEFKENAQAVKELMVIRNSLWESHSLYAKRLRGLMAQEETWKMGGTTCKVTYNCETLRFDIVARLCTNRGRDLERFTYRAETSSAIREIGEVKISRLRA